MGRHELNSIKGGDSLQNVIEEGREADHNRDETTAAENATKNEAGNTAENAMRNTAENAAEKSGTAQEQGVIRRVLLIDDHQIVRDSFRKVFSRANGFEVVKELTKATDAESACLACQPDVVLLDVCTEGGASGLDSLAQLRARFPNLKIVVMSGFDEISYAPRAKELGANAFVFKSKSTEFFLETVRDVLRGGSRFPEPSMIPLPKGETPLSERETEILRLLCAHKNRSEVAETLHISEKSVILQVESMLAKTGFSSTVELIIHVISNGWINPNS